jgi:hypothetical protein
MATLKTLYRQFEESSNFNKTYTDAIIRARVSEGSVSDGTLNSLKLTTTELYVNEEGKVSSFYVGVEAKMSDTTLDIEIGYKTVDTELHRIFQKIPLSLLNECKLYLGGESSEEHSSFGDIFHEYVEKPYTTLYWALGNNVDLSELEGL